MNWMRSYDTVILAAGVATAQFGVSMLESDYRKTALRFLCSGIDEFAKQNNAVTYEVVIDEETKEFIISVECEPFVLEEITNVFYNLVKCVKKIQLTAVDEFYVRVSFYF